MVNFLNKLREKPEGERKIILWVVVVAVALILSVVYIFYIRWKVADFQKKGFDLPAIEVQSLNLEIPDYITDNLASADNEIKNSNLKN